MCYLRCVDKMADLQHCQKMASWDAVRVERPLCSSAFSVLLEVCGQDGGVTALSQNGFLGRCEG